MRLERDRSEVLTLCLGGIRIRLRARACFSNVSREKEYWTAMFRSDPAIVEPPPLGSARIRILGFLLGIVEALTPRSGGEIGLDFMTHSRRYWHVCKYQV